MHNLQVQSMGVQFLIFALNSFSELEFLIDPGRSCHVFWPLYDNVSVPKYTVLTLDDCQHLWLLRWCIFSYVGESSCSGVGTSFMFILNISIASFYGEYNEICKLQVLYSCLEWNIQVNGQSLNWKSMKVFISIFNLSDFRYLAILASACSFWLAFLQIFVTCSLKFSLLSIVTPNSLHWPHQ